MTDVFRLTVPYDARFRALIGEVAGRYLELAGGTADEARALAAEVSAAMDRLQAGEWSSIAAVVRQTAGDVSIRLQDGGRSATVIHRAPAKKP
jgi:hypothetical protein